MKIQYYCDSKPDPPYFYGIFSQKHCNKFSEFQALFLVLNGTAVISLWNFARRVFGHIDIITLEIKHTRLYSANEVNQNPLIKGSFDAAIPVYRQ